MSLEQGTEGMRQASFTIWAARGAQRSVIPGAECRAISSGGIPGAGRTCAIPYDFRTDRWYLLRTCPEQSRQHPMLSGRFGRDTHRPRSDAVRQRRAAARRTMGGLQ